MNRKDMIVLTELIRAGMVAPIMDRTYPMSEIVEAFRHLETNHARGKIVVSAYV